MESIENRGHLQAAYADRGKLQGCKKRALWRWRDSPSESLSTPNRSAFTDLGFGQLHHLFNGVAGP
jgi:hypothetical protein